MLSRVAHATYWMNRYIERAENVARVIDVNLHLAFDLPEGHVGQWEPLVITTGDERIFRERYGEASQKNVIHFLTFDETNPNSILSCLKQARENGRSIREIISSEMWQHINRSYLAVTDAIATGNAAANPHELFESIKSDSYLFSGLMDATMSHGEAWHFGRMGRLIERADKTSRILDVTYFVLGSRPSEVGSPFDDLQWQALLKSTSALEIYRKERRRRITPRDVADFLVLDRRFPRSIRYCVTKAEESLQMIGGAPGRSFQNSAEKRLGRLRSELDYLDVKDVLHRGLHPFLDKIQTELNYVGDGIHETFFATRPVEARAPQDGLTQ